MVRAAGGKPVWMTLQIAWSGTVTSARKPNVVPRFPTLHELRFMAYQAIVAGARGLMFFGGHLTQVSRPADADAGWNWTFWEQVLRPLLQELSSTAVAPALVAANAKPQVKASAKDVEVLTRRDGRFLYVLAVRRGGTTSRVAFTGLPKKLNGRPLTGGQVLFEYAQEPPPPPIGAGRQVFRSVSRRRRLPGLARPARCPRLPVRALMIRCGWVPSTTRSTSPTTTTSGACPSATSGRSSSC